MTQIYIYVYLYFYVCVGKMSEKEKNMLKPRGVWLCVFFINVMEEKTV